MALDWDKFTRRCQAESFFGTLYRRNILRTSNKTSISTRAGLLSCRIRSELFDLHFQLLDFSLLGFDRFNQQGCEPGVVHALYCTSLWVAGDHFRHDLSHVLSHDADFVSAIIPAIIRDALELLDLFQRSL